MNKLHLYRVESESTITENNCFYSISSLSYERFIKNPFLFQTISSYKSFIILENNFPSSLEINKIINLYFLGYKLIKANEFSKDYIFSYDNYSIYISDDFIISIFITDFKDFLYYLWENRSWFISGFLVLSNKNIKTLEYFKILPSVEDSFYDFLHYHFDKKFLF